MIAHVRDVLDSLTLRPGERDRPDIETLLTDCVLWSRDRWTFRLEGEVNRG
jgi:hypothetical protein